MPNRLQKVRIWHFWTFKFVKIVLSEHVTNLQRGAQGIHFILLLLSGTCYSTYSEHCTCTVSQNKFILFVDTYINHVSFVLYFLFKVNAMLLRVYTVSTNSDKFPNIFGGSDANLCIWKNFLIQYILKSYKFGNIS